MPVQLINDATYELGNNTEVLFWQNCDTIK